MHRLVVVLVAVATLAVAGGDDDTAADPTSTTTTTSTTSTSSTTTSTTASTTSTTTSTSTTTTTPTPDPCDVIGDDGRPVVATGTTIEEMLTVLGPGWSSTPDVAFLVDIEGHHLECGGERRFYGAWSVGSPEIVDLVLSDHPDFTDPAGVGPGMVVTDAIALHGGSATVGINTEFEQREFITFADGGTPGWRYQVRGPDFSWAGVYPEPLDGYVETSTFVAGAAIERIWWR